MTRSESGGFTLIELIVVIGIIVLLTGMTFPAVMTITRRAASENGVRSIVEATRVASDLARRHQPEPGPNAPFFGVAISAQADGSAPRILVTWGTAYPPTAADALKRKALSWSNWSEYTTAPDEAGAPHVWAKQLPGSVRLHRPVADPLLDQPVANVGWLHQYRTGFPIVQASNAAPPHSVGVDPDPLIILKSGSSVNRVAIYDFGFAKAIHVR